MSGFARLENLRQLSTLVVDVLLPTFGNVDGMCLMTEYAMNVLGLKDRVTDKH
ncbi:hypothetical protein KIN20_010402 [Parelaphostrongylus tenuis]|uniref:Uncharacterized protein n=1 Tax=Parelaphostrongylus tenuis TaxID=148309 RepID=A0AAD5MRW0_PARTN|nr:hypothetical protein KIN20_010402 [Parelaphostrongylus tenuis]